MTLKSLSGDWFMLLDTVLRIASFEKLLDCRLMYSSRFGRRWRHNTILYDLTYNLWLHGVLFSLPRISNIEVRICCLDNLWCEYTPPTKPLSCSASFNKWLCTVRNNDYISTGTVNARCFWSTAKLISKWILVKNLGQFKRLLDPGLHFLCWPIQNVIGTLPLRLQQLDVCCKAKTEDNVLVSFSFSSSVDSIFRIAPWLSIDVQ